MIDVCVNRPGSTYVALDVSLNEVLSSEEDRLELGTQLTQALMAADNKILYDGVLREAAIVQIFDRQIVIVNGTFEANAAASE